MKYFVILFLLAVAFVAYEAHEYAPPVNTTKLVIRTLSGVETRAQGYPETAYWAVAADGTSVRISRGLYAQLDSGSVLVSSGWSR